MSSRREFLKFLSTLPLVGIAKIEKTREGTRYLLHECFVAGFRFHQGPALLSRMGVGTALEITAEPDNSYDPFAVRLDYNGAQIGYLPKSQNQVISRLLQQGAPIECHIARIDKDAPPWQAVTVQVSILIEGE